MILSTPNEMKTVPVDIIHLEMGTPPAESPPPLADGITVRQVPDPDVTHYRQLYLSVGRNYHWIDREVMPDDELQAILRHPAVSVYVLEVDGDQAGFAELDARKNPDVEIVYFGLTSSYIGRGFARPFFDHVLDHAWKRARCVWLHTCSLDHPAALPFYQSYGLTVRRYETRRQPLRPEAQGGTMGPA
ncbi:MAG: GNAT family N-acetyltransferase [Bacteroidota bacterium]